MTKLNIAVAGSSGRMGRALLNAITQESDLCLLAALEQPGNPYLTKDVGELVGVHCGVTITDNFSTALPGCDLLIDFTRPAGTLEHLLICRTEKVKMVIGTTGFSKEQKKVLKELSRKNLERLVHETKQDNEQSMKAILKNGVTLAQKPSAEELREFQQAGAVIRKNLMGKLFTQDLLNRVMSHLVEIR